MIFLKNEKIQNVVDFLKAKKTNRVYFHVKVEWSLDGHIGELEDGLISSRYCDFKKLNLQSNESCQIEVHTVPITIEFFNKHEIFNNPKTTEKPISCFFNELAELEKGQLRGFYHTNNEVLHTGLIGKCENCKNDKKSGYAEWRRFNF